MSYSKQANISETSYNKRKIGKKNNQNICKKIETRKLKNQKTNRDSLMCEKEEPMKSDTMNEKNNNISESKKNEKNQAEIEIVEKPFRTEKFKLINQEGRRKVKKLSRCDENCHIKENKQLMNAESQNNILSDDKLEIKLNNEKEICHQCSKKIKNKCAECLKCSKKYHFFLFGKYKTAR